MRRSGFALHSPRRRVGPAAALGLAEQYGNASFQIGANALGAEFGSLTGRELATMSGHEAVKDVSRILLLLAGGSLLASLFRLAGVTGCSRPAALRRCSCSTGS